ncbi:MULTISPECIES: response regulator [Pseudomonas]|uniref:response regulator n=1 Tax=Pseudomonas TaxID=286 RepID=UPI001E55DA37|nr:MULTISPECIES: response regulator [Pseudomonas]MCD5983219.1 response regulator [Pseudomonas sp. CDFA 610]MCQ9469320.1 response regulator [Pseudomonas alliivorans]
MVQRLLIVSDSSVLCRMLVITLKGAGYSALECCGSARTLDRLGQSRTHLIIIDRDLTTMDSLALIEQIRHRPDCRFTPILLLAAHRDGWMALRGQELGIRDWLVKPFQPQHLLVMVSRLILA